MTSVYMPFTHLSAPAARLLAGLVGPVVVYQPIATAIPESLSSLAAQGLVHIRTPLAGDEARLTAAVKEFSGWAQLNPSATTPGAAYFGARQGAVPFFDETVANRIRSEIMHYGSGDASRERCEAEFSVRLFLAVAQANDQATEHLDHDLRDFKAREKDFLDLLADSDEADFNRGTLGGGLWREDPGARLTGQRIRAWAGLAAADAACPDLWITTSRAVIDALLEGGDPTLEIAPLTVIRRALPAAGADAVLAPALGDLSQRAALTGDDLAGIAALTQTHAAASLTVSLFAVRDRTPAAVLRRLSPAALREAVDEGGAALPRHTLIMLLEQDPES